MANLLRRFPPVCLVLFSLILVLGPVGENSSLTKGPYSVFRETADHVKKRSSPVCAETYLNSTFVRHWFCLPEHPHHLGFAASGTDRPA
jgi:hypothetical protein